MKKTILLSLLFVLSVTAINAQLTDTKWKNIMNIPDPYETILSFKKDTVILTMSADGTVIETMNYSISKDTLKLLKLSGMSPCGDNITGLYKFEIKDDKMTIVPISDDCNERAGAFKPEPWIKEKG